MSQLIPAPTGSYLRWRGKHGLVSRILLGFMAETGKRPTPVVIGPILVPVAETCACLKGWGFVSMSTGRVYVSVDEWDETERDVEDDVFADAPGGTVVRPEDLDVLRTDKGFKKQSFWRFDGPETEPFMFIVDAGDYIPEDARVKKITRTVFEANRASEAVVPYDQLFGPAPGKTASAEPAPSEDDDAGEDLI